ncbi:MAG: DUF551 domain-containing protein [Coprobacillus sp.]|nr:DUF551 domain-containing protein [Coprobacillus sp.]
MNYIKELQEKNEWISVEERLPDIAGYPCLCTIENMYGQRKVAKLFNNYGNEPFWLCNEKEIDLNVWKVIAWMPLPKPYEGENEE